jgi:SAM-dependent methyltransferase
VDWGLKFPTVDDWWQASAAYPEFRRPSLTPLKDYGYLEVLRRMDALNPKRVLEFGHGLEHTNERTLYSRGERLEFWAVDDYQGLYYYPTEQQWLKDYTAFTSRHAKVKFVRALLGSREQTRALIPEDYFDLIFSVSVLEEVSLKTFGDIVAHCFVLLRPGGHLIFSHDLRVGHPKRLRRILKVLKNSGFVVRSRWKDRFFPNWKTLLLEHQLMVMLHYQANEPNDQTRHYQGNWTTFIVDALRPNHR